MGFCSDKPNSLFLIHLFSLLYISMENPTFENYPLK